MPAKTAGDMKFQYFGHLYKNGVQVFEKSKKVFQNCYEYEEQENDVNASHDCNAAYNHKKLTSIKAIIHDNNSNSLILVGKTQLLYY